MSVSEQEIQDFMDRFEPYLEHATIQPSKPVYRVKYKGRFLVRKSKSSWPSVGAAKNATHLIFDDWVFPNYNKEILHKLIEMGVVEIVEC